MQLTDRLCKMILALLLALAALAPGAARGAVSTEGKPWQAQWIGAPTTATTNVWTCFRKTFDMDAVNTATSVMTRVAVDSKYWLWVNGELMVFEGGLKRGPNPTDTWYDEIDLKGKLKKGKNTIAILATYWGVSGFSHNSSGKAGLVFEADLGKGRLLTSDASWKALIHPAYGLAAVQPNTLTNGKMGIVRLSERNICFDARKDIGEWWKPEFEDKGWKAAETYGRPPVAPWNKLWKRPIPQWLDSGLVDYYGKLPRVTDGKPLVLTLARNLQVTPFISIKAPAGLKIAMRTDHTTVTGVTSIYTEYITREGEQSFETPCWMNGEKIILDMPAGITLLGAQYRISGYGATRQGTFRSNDPFLGELWRRAANTLYVNMRDNYFDCPDRERALWWGDVHIDLGMVAYCLDRRADQLTRKAIYELINWRRADKTLHAPVPGVYPQELPAQMLASIGQYGFWTYYMNTNDKATVLEAWPAARDYLALWKVDGDGLVAHRGVEAGTKDGPIWDWMDWGKEIDARLMDQGWYCLALQGAANMARLAGQAAEAEQYEKVRQGVIAATNKRFWNGTAYRDPAYKGATDDRGNALAVVAGIAGKEKFEALRKVLATEYHASPYMEKYCLEALLLMDATDEALARMRKRYAEVMPEEWTTLPELFTMPQCGTTNHAWSGGPLTLLSQYVAGLAPVEPGFKTFAVRPQLGSRLKQLQCQFWAPMGPVSVEIRREPKRYEMQLFIPRGTEAIVRMPKKDAAAFKEIRAVNRAAVAWSADGKTTSASVKGLKIAAETEQYVEFRLEADEWKLRGEVEPQPLPPPVLNKPTVRGGRKGGAPGQPSIIVQPAQPGKPGSGPSIIIQPAQPGGAAPGAAAPGAKK